MEDKNSEDLCITCTTDKKDCYFAQGIEKAYACVRYEDKRKLSSCCKSQVVLHRGEYVCGCCGMTHKKV